MKNIEKKKEKLMMQSFVQYTPTKVVFGKATQKEAGKLVSELEITKVLYMAVEVQSIQQKELR
jgi:alcohol dehydrogenase YqhD (iron-dependent ADH family)